MPSLPPRTASLSRPPRPTTAERGYDARWRKLRIQHLRQHPFCEHCKRDGRAELATEVDHIRPISTGGGVLDPDNLQSLCKPCHSRKTLAENRP